MNLDKKIYQENTEQMCSHINVGNGEELTIQELAEIIKDVIGFKGNINLG